MPAGFEMIGDSGSILIDENYMNLQFLVKGTLTLSTRVRNIADPAVRPQILDKINNAWMANSGDPGFTGTDQFIAFRPRSGFQVGIGYRDFGPVFVGHAIGTTAPVVDWWIFGRAPARSSGQGLEIYDAQGRVVFSNDKKPMKIVAAQSNMTLSGNALVAPVPGDYAICVGWPWPAVMNGDYEYTGQWHVAERMPFWSAPTSTGFAAPLPQYSYARIQSSTPSGVAWSSMTNTSLLIDVAGL